MATSCTTQTFFRTCNVRLRSWCVCREAGRISEHQLSVLEFPMFKTQPRRHKQTGFTIVEALIALAVMGFGLLSLASMQLKLAGTGDVARQRTEAIRLAEQKIEELRSFTGISSGTINWNGLANGTDTITPSTYLVGSTNGTNVSY